MEWGILHCTCHKGRKFFSGLCGVYSIFIRYAYGLYSGRLREVFGKASGVPEGFPKESRRNHETNPWKTRNHIEPI
jgi:hypothetical protein